MTNEAAVDTRAQLRTSTPEEFQKAHTKDQLIAIATNMGIEEPAGTKTEIYDAIIKGAKLPDPSLRGKSDANGPVAKMWNMCDNAFAEAKKAKADPPRRKDMVAAAQDAGIAYYTARTQYQAWFSATTKGTVRLQDLPVESLPKNMRS